MNTINSYRFAVGAMVGALLLGCASAFAAGLGTRADLLLAPSYATVVGSASAKNSKLNNFVTNVSLQSKDTARDTFEVWVISPADASSPTYGAGFYAGTFTTSAGGKGGVLYVNNFTVHGDFVVSVWDTSIGELFAETDTMTLP